LCQGTITTAERIRHAATINIPDAAWSPALTTDSLRHAATCSTVISHNCEILLRTLATRAGQHGADGIADRLLGCADATGQARAAWLHTARAWRWITTDTRGTITSAAAETADLALWTGRLAYADPGWIPAHGPSHATRLPEALAPEPGDLSLVMAAVHQASETLIHIAAADHSQISAAAAAGRLLVPTRSLPDRFDIPHPFAPAPRDRVNALLDAYDNAGTASAQPSGCRVPPSAPARGWWKRHAGTPGQLRGEPERDRRQDTATLRQNRCGSPEDNLVNNPGCGPCPQPILEEVLRGEMQSSQAQTLGCGSPAAYWCQSCRVGGPTSVQSAS